MFAIFGNFATSTRIKERNALFCRRDLLPSINLRPPCGTLRDEDDELVLQCWNYSPLCMWYIPLKIKHKFLEGKRAWEIHSPSSTPASPPLPRQTHIHFTISSIIEMFRGIWAMPSRETQTLINLHYSSLFSPSVSSEPFSVSLHLVQMRLYLSPALYTQSKTTFCSSSPGYMVL